ncbi:helix-hairpin-helix domain-containing protein [Georgenia phoenicis]|uniref:helix-hairpin-helix domain-containing protein n=1 Tax=unclassified Georgenia TaxID=2626815 RepID=UPI0039AF8EF5
MSSDDAPGPDLPRIGRPATNALLERGVTSLEQVAAMSERELLALHGVGPRAVRLLREALAARGRDLAP